HEVLLRTLPRSINDPHVNKPDTLAGWAYDPESDDLPLVVLADTRELAQMLWDHLIRVGIDDVSGFVTGLDGLPTVVPDLLSPQALTPTNFDLRLAARNAAEYAEGTIPGAQQPSAGRVLWNQDQLPDDGTVVTFCRSGVRNSVAASALRRAGHHVVELEGSYLGWQAAQK